MSICPRPRRILLFLLGAVVGLVGCTRPAPPADGRLAVVTSISPLGDLIRRVGGDRVTVTDLVPRGADPHEFEPRPADVTAVARARLLIANGLDLEGFLDKLVKNAGSKDLKVVLLSQAAGTFRAGGLSYDPAKAENPHVWLSVAGASAYVGAVADALSAADPPGAGGQPAPRGRAPPGEGPTTAPGWKPTARNWPPWTGGSASRWRRLRRPTVRWWFSTTPGITSACSTGFSRCHW